MGSGRQPDDVEAGAAPPAAGVAPGDPPAVSAAFGAGFPPPRKSVSYQPEPLSLNPAAVTCFS
jgi:hypothetical protein